MDLTGKNVRTQEQKQQSKVRGENLKALGNSMFLQKPDNSQGQKQAKGAEAGHFEIHPGTTFSSFI